MDLQKAAKTRHETLIDKLANIMSVAKDRHRNSGRETGQTRNTKITYLIEAQQTQKTVLEELQTQPQSSSLLFSSKGVLEMSKMGRTMSQCKGSVAKAQYLCDEEDDSDCELVGHEQSIRSKYETICSSVARHEAVRQLPR